jgi:arginase
MKPMTDQMILTPYFMDQLVPQMQPLLAPGWLLVQPAATDDLHEQIKANTADLADTVAGALKLGERPVSIAGDCMSPIGMLAGLTRAQVAPTLIWFDAHGDFNTPETSPSGFLGGMPLAMLVGRGDQRFMENVALPPIPEDRVILTDARDLDPGERELVEKSAVRHLPDVTDLLTLDLPDGPLYIHFDADVLDPSEAPAHRYTAPGGASVAQMREVFAHLAATGRVAAISVSAWDFANDTDEKTGQAVMDLLRVLQS